MSKIVIFKDYHLSDEKGGEGMLEKLGVYGMDEIEDFILASLVTGDPILLIGDIGSAKTLLSRRLAEALGLKFHSYDASKALFEDVIGFPNPESFKEGKIEYAKTDVSIWDKEFILIDEVSRAEPTMQNKWLEVIRERSIMGKKIKNLKYIFGAMNPPKNYLGTNYLDRALAGRFSLFIEVPPITSMGKEDMKKVIKAVSEEDAPMISKKRRINSLDLKNFIKRARENFQKVERKYDNIITKYISNLIEELKKEEIEIDGRRAGMIRRNIIGLISVKITNGKFKKNNLFSIFYKTLLLSLPFKVTGEKFESETLSLIHNKIIKNFDFIKENEIEEEIDYEKILSRLCDEYLQEDETQKKIKINVELYSFFKKLFTTNKKLSKSFVSKSLRIFVERLIEAYPNFPISNLFIHSSFLPDLNKKSDCLALRFVIYDFSHSKDFRIEFESPQKLFYEYKDYMEEKDKEGK